MRAATNNKGKMPKDNTNRGSKASSSKPRHNRLPRFRSGQSPDEVKGLLGQPEKVANLGAIEIFVYKDLKVTFINGKVVDVQ